VKTEASAQCAQTVFGAGERRQRNGRNLFIHARACAQTHRPTSLTPAPVTPVYLRRNWAAPASREPWKSLSRAPPIRQGGWSLFMSGAIDASDRDSATRDQLEDKHDRGNDQQ
jgi:hypothetical protein